MLSLAIFLIQTVSEDVWDKDIVKRTFKVTNAHQVRRHQFYTTSFTPPVLLLTQQDATRTITQLQYVEWSHDSCPNDHLPVVDLIKVLDYVQHENGNGPVTVHCRYYIKYQTKCIK